MVEVRVGGIRFEDWPDDYDNCFLISRNGLRNWRGGDLRREEIQRPLSHGAFDLPGYRAQQLPTLSGTLLASSPQKLQHMKNQVLGVLSDGAFGRMVVDDDQGSAWRDVRLLSCADPEDLDDLSATFSLSFWAADPRLFGEENEYPGGAPAINRGNFPASPELIVTGSMPGYSVHGPDGRVLTVSQGLSAGQTHRIDLLTGRVYRDGVLQVGVRRGPVWTVPASSAVVHTLVPASGSGALTVRVTDTFI